MPVAMFDTRGDSHRLLFNSPLLNFNKLVRLATKLANLVRVRGRGKGRWTKVSSMLTGLLCTTPPRVIVKEVDISADNPFVKLEETYEAAFGYAV